MLRAIDKDQGGAGQDAPVHFSIPPESSTALNLTVRETGGGASLLANTPAAAAAGSPALTLCLFPCHVTRCDSQPGAPVGPGAPAWFRLVLARPLRAGGVTRRRLGSDQHGHGDRDRLPLPARRHADGGTRPTAGAALGAVRRLPAGAVRLHLAHLQPGYTASHAGLCYHAPG